MTLRNLIPTDAVQGLIAGTTIGTGLLAGFAYSVGDNVVCLMLIAMAAVPPLLTQALRP